jgi:hypothetical protein
MPVLPDSHQHSTSSDYFLPNLTGSEPSTLFTSPESVQKNQNGWIKLVLPSSRISTEEREYFETILQAGGGGGGATGQRSFELLERNQLYVVDERNGKILGQLDDASSGTISLEEDSQVSNGQMHDDGNKIQASEVDTFNLDGKEAVVINSLESTSSNSNSNNKPTWNASRFSVKPLSSYYTPAPNPDQSTIISIGNFISHGLVIGSSLLSQGFEKGAGHYVSSRPATNSPMVFKETTKKNWENASKHTGKAVQYSGQATQYVGRFATNVGDRIGKATGIQSTSSLLLISFD